jgi:hypothetical protein
MIALAAGTAALAGLELVARRRLVPLGFGVLVTAPAEAATLLAANWQAHVDRTVANGLVTATVFLLSGLAVSTLALVVEGRSAVGRLGLAAVAGSTAILDVLALAITWTGSLPGEALRALLSLVFLTIVLYLLTALAARHSVP